MQKSLKMFLMLPIVQKSNCLNNKRLKIPSMPPSCTHASIFLDSSNCVFHDHTSWSQFLRVIPKNTWNTCHPSRIWNSKRSRSRISTICQQIMTRCQKSILNNTRLIEDCFIIVSSFWNHINEVRITKRMEGCQSVVHGNWKKISLTWISCFQVQNFSLMVDNDLCYQRMDPLVSSVECSLMNRWTIDGMMSAIDCTNCSWKKWSKSMWIQNLFFMCWHPNFVVEPVDQNWKNVMNVPWHLCCIDTKQGCQGPILFVTWRIFYFWNCSDESWQTRCEFGLQ